MKPVYVYSIDKYIEWTEKMRPEIFRLFSIKRTFSQKVQFILAVQSDKNKSHDINILYSVHFFYLNLKKFKLASHWIKA